MRGLRTQESHKFNRFFDLVQKEAKKKNSVFFMDCGEGREMFTPELEGEDASGWLIPEALADEFEKVFESGDEPEEKWDQFFKVERWSLNGDRVCIRFYEVV